MTKLVIGTWKMLDNLSWDDSIKFINDCVKLGVKYYDTASVYSDGKAEILLGISDAQSIITKIPADNKPKQYQRSTIDDCYRLESVMSCVEKSLDRMDEKIDYLLLHNWHESWDEKNDIFRYLLEIKEKRKCLLGISLPNGFDGEINTNVLKIVDLIMAAANHNNQWIYKNYKKLIERNVAIACRSVFEGGNCVPKNKDELKKIIKTNYFADYLVIGSTSIDHVKDTIKALEEIESEN